MKKNNLVFMIILFLFLGGVVLFILFRAGTKCVPPETADSHIRVNLGRLRFVASEIYSQDGNYNKLTLNHPEVNSIARKIQSVCGKLILYKNTSRFCAYSRLPIKQSWYCVDSKGTAIQTSINPSTTCNKKNYECPKPSAPSFSSEFLPKNAVTSTASPTKIEKWKIYKSDKSNITLRYPATWKDLKEISPQSSEYQKKGIYEFFALDREDENMVIDIWYHPSSKSIAFERKRRYKPLKEEEGEYSTFGVIKEDKIIPIYTLSKKAAHDGWFLVFNNFSSDGRYVSFIITDDIEVNSFIVDIETREDILTNYKKQISLLDVVWSEDGKNLVILSRFNRLSDSPYGDSLIVSDYNNPRRLNQLLSFPRKEELYGLCPVPSEEKERRRFLNGSCVKDLRFLNNNKTLGFTLLIRNCKFDPNLSKLQCTSKEKEYNYDMQTKLLKEK